MKRTSLIVLSLVAAACGEPSQKEPPVVIIANNTTTPNLVTTSNSATNGPTNGATNNVRSSLSAEEFIARYQTTFCAAIFECPNAVTLGYLRSYSRHGTAEACASAEDVAYGPVYDVPGAIEAGAIAYDPAHAEQCLADLRAAFCDGTLNRTGTWGIPSCFDALRGTVPLGGPCVTAYDCADGYCNSGSACGMGVCTRSAQDCGGTRCDTESEYCDFATESCRPRREPGASCDYGQCATGAFCDAAQGGTCVAWGSTPAGGACVIEYSCATELICDENRCAAPVFGAAGAPCTLSGARACEPGLVCRLAARETEGTCGAPLPAGSSCAADFVCAPGTMCNVWGDSTCTPYRADGETCQSFAQCASRSCPGGMGSAADGTCATACTY